MLLHHTFARTAERLGDKTALVCKGQRHSYAVLHAQARQLACALQSRGVQRGDRVAIFLENSAQAVIAIYASLYSGAVFMPVNPSTKQDKLAYILNDARPACLIADARLQGVFAQAAQAVPELHTCVLVGAGDSMLNGKTLPWAEAMSARPQVRDPGSIDQDLAAIIYTSGSTGDPKGVMLSHRNMLTAAESISTYLGLHEDDVILCASPLSFDYGLYQILMGFKVGASVILERAFAYPAKVLETMAAERVTVFPGVPTMFSLLLELDSLPRYDLRSLRLITNTAAALSERHIQDIRRAFPQARLYSMYGLTECKRVSYLPPEELDRRPTSVGRGMPNEEVYLVDEAGRRLPPGSTGQLVVRGSHVMRGYWNKPEETAKRLKPGPYPGEYVLYSGDIFRTDSEGYLYFVARSDDVIKSRGEKVSPKEVENALYALEGVLEAAVVGVDDALLGQAVKAFVVLKQGYRYSDKEVIRHCMTKLENFMTPKYVEFVDSLPKTDTGKIKKTGLVAPAAKGAGAAVEDKRTMQGV